MSVACITGMHRSGTSLLMRIANLLGVDLGDQEKLLPPGEDNLAGYWEHSDILRVDNALLEGLGGSWDRLPHLPPGWQHREDLADLRVQASKSLESFPDDAEVIGWKDPRISVLLPFWRTIVDIDRTVVAIRHPAAVAGSLQRRNGFTLQHATALWLRYTLEALVNDPGALVVRYSDMLEDSESTARALAAHLRLPEPDDATLEQIRGFVQPSLAHETEQRAPDSPTLRFATRIFEDITADRDSLDLDELQGLAASWNEAAQSVGGAVTDLQAKLEEQREQTRNESQRVNHLRTQQSQLRSKLQETEKSLKQEQENSEEVDNLRRALTRKRRQAKDLELEAEFERARAARLRFDLGEEERRKQELARLESELRKSRESYDELRGRISVRAALPVAEIVRRFLVVLRWIRRQSQRSPSAAPTTTGEKEADGKSDQATVSRDQSSQEPPTERSAPSQQESAGVDVARGEERHSGAAATEALVGALHAATPVSIIVPIYNAVDDLRRCVASIRGNTTFPAELLLINDASPDPRVATYLDELEGIDGVRVLHNAENLGFSGTINRGIRESVGDVVVLNSDTEVTPRWLTNLALAVYENPTVGSATPVLDNADAFSVPERGKHNATPGHLSRDEVGRLITRTSQRVRPDTPTANGVCMYLKRAMLDTMDLFNDREFPRGYGEENDFCMRAKKAGWLHVVDDATFIFHKGSVSFGEEKQALLEAGLAKVHELHPEYHQLVQPFIQGPQMQAVRETVRVAFDDPPRRCPPRILHVLHTGSGGVPIFNDDLAGGLDDRYEHLQLASDASSLFLRRYDDGQWVDIESFSIEPSVSILDHHHRGYRHEVTRILEDYDVEIVHIQSLLHHAHDLPLVADAMGIAVIATLHDYFLICPTIQLLDDQERFCGGVCTPGQGSCRTGMRWVANDVPHLKHAWVHEWQRRISDVLQATDALVAPTNAVRQTYLRAYPDLPDGRITTIEHGEDAPIGETEVALPQADEPLRVLTLGNINYHKGGKVLEEILALDAEEGEIELHILGSVAPEYSSLGQQHGHYQRQELPELMEKIKPALVLLLSPWGETFCYTLTEAWACGVPVVAADIGALGERVREHGGGWVVDPHDSEVVYRTVLQAGRDEEGYRRAAAAAHSYRPRSVAEMADDYDALYRGVLARRGPSSYPATSGTSAVHSGEVS